jgi:transposase
LRVSGSKHHAPGKPSPPPLQQERELENERLRRDNERLRQELLDSREQLAEAEKQIADLERQLGLRQQNSTTSSKPPSSDGLAGEQREGGSKRKKSRRKPGGQPGHQGHWRGLAPANRVNEVVQLFPSTCRYCQHSFTGDGQQPATQGEPKRHQVTELPKIEAHITEYRCENALCPECGKTTQA